MTEFENNGPFPVPPQDDENEVKSFRLSIETPDPDMTHCRVPLSAWLSETKTFCKRYFWRLLLLSLIFSVFSFLAYSAQWSSRNANPLNTAVSSSHAVRDAGEEKVDFFDNDAANPDKKDAPAESKSAAAPVYCPIAFEKLGCFSGVFKICTLLFQLLVLAWVIRTIRQDNPAWRNLWFDSWGAFFKAVASVLVFMICVVTVLIFLGCLAPLFKKIFPTAATAVQLLCFLFIVALFTVKFALTIPLIVDRNFGPFRAMSISWTYMRSNIGTLIWGGIITCLGCFLLALLVSIPLGLLLAKHFDVAHSSPEAIQQALFSTPSVYWTVSALTVALSALMSTWTYGFSSIFYLMATGQERPGAWPRDVEPAAEQGDRNE